MRTKVLFAVVMGLLAAALTPLPGTSGIRPTLPTAQLAAVSTARTQQPQTASPAAAADGVAMGRRWHRRPVHLPRPLRHGGQPSPSPSGAPSPAPSGAPSPAPSGAPSPAPSGMPAPPPAVQAVNCALIVPAQPLTARGLATPWQLTADGAGPCSESNPDDSAFVEAAVLDPATGQVSAYDPLVVDQGAMPAVAPTPPVLPAGAVVGIWVGYNGDNLRLRGPGSQACVNGIGDSIFGQNAFCNATAFFAGANQAIQSGKLVVPALGTGKDGRPCPTTRDFSVVDQDQSDNTTITYLVTADGRLAQSTPANEAALQGAKVAKNGSDEGLLVHAIDGALSCTPWTVPDLADASHQQRLTSWPLNELMAAARQAPPAALVPAGDPFVFEGNAPSLEKLNAFRAGVGQPQVASLAEADTATYCRNLLSTGLPRIAADRQFTQAAASPFPADASNLFNFLALRFSQTFSNGDGFLHCEQLLGVRNPVRLQMTDGVVTGAVIDLHPAPANPRNP